MRSAPTGSTRVAAVIGDPVDHSLSPVIHNAAFEALRLDWVYVAMPVPRGSGAAAVAGMRALGIAGLSVTMPHKADILASVDDVTPVVRALRSANTVVRSPDGSLCAHSTDGDGCVDALRAAGVEVDGKRCMVIGAGGAGRAVVLALAIAGAASIVVVNRDAARAAAAVALGGAIARHGSADIASECDIVINATPLGMGGDLHLPLDPVRLGPGQVVNDLIYHPLVTPLMAAASERGTLVVGGLGMLLHQAGRQFTLWTGHEAPLDAMRAAVEAELTRRG